jgi:hypothetical protein
VSEEHGEKLNWGGEAGVVVAGPGINVLFKVREEGRGGESVRSDSGGAEETVVGGRGEGETGRGLARGFFV